MKIRQRLIDTGVLEDKIDCFEFTEDYLFSSPSTAASIVMGRNANGQKEWKLKSGTTLKDFETNS